MPSKKGFLRLLAFLCSVCLATFGYAAAGYLYESDNSTGTIYQFTTLPLSGQVVKVAFATGLDNVRGLVFDRSGNLFVGQSTTIVKIEPNGFMSVFASDIHGPNSFAFNRAGDLFVTDRDGNVLRFKPDGAASVYYPGFEKPTGLAFDAADNLFVADFGANAIFKITSTGAKSTFAYNMKGPQALAFDRNGILNAVNNANGTIEGFTPLGSRFIRVFGLHSPGGIVFDKDGNLFVAENCNGTGTNSIVKFTVGTEIGTTYASGLGCPLQLAFEPARDPLFNISTRARVEPIQTHELIGGFIVTGNEPKTVLLRAVGPSLSKSSIFNPLRDPILELHTPDGVITNDDWMDSQKAEIQGTGLSPSDNRESAILITLAPGTYTAVVRGKSSADAGVALVEVYDADLGADSTLANISSRGYVQTDDNRMIAGLFVGGGNGAGRVLIRGLGPSLSDAGIVDPIPDPTLIVNDANGVPVANNDDWAATQAYEIESTGIPPLNPREAAIVVTLKNGPYTAILQDAKGKPGVGLIEVYNLR